jgi:NADH:ubiquinone oxidoreductase subunit 6 (subunit J)
MTDEKISPEESLQLIRSMIDKTKQDISDNSIYFLVWGWITFIACAGQFILKHIYEYPRHYMVWWISVVGIIFTFYQGMKEGKTRKVKTYVSESIKYLWMGMGLAFLVLSMILTKIGWDRPVFPFFIMLYGLGTFISGNIIQFRPLVIGGIAAFALAVGSAFVVYDYQMLFAAAALLVSYIIPAYMLRARKHSF